MSIINSDISKAETLPSRYYIDSETFEKLRTKFTSNWHFAAHISEFDENNVDIAGWKIQCCNRKYTFVFPSGTIIKGGTSYCVYTNETHHKTGDGGFSTGSKRLIWNNAKNGDQGTLYDVSGHVVSVLGFGSWAVEGIEDDGSGVKMIGFDAQPKPEVYP